jgi:hypothetical protein
MLLNSFCTAHQSSVSIGFTEQIMRILRILCYNGSLVIRKVVSLTTVKFKPLIFSMSDFRLSYAAKKKYITYSYSSTHS